MTPLPSGPEVVPCLSAGGILVLGLGRHRQCAVPCHVPALPGDSPAQPGHGVAPPAFCGRPVPGAGILELPGERRLTARAKLVACIRAFKCLEPASNLGAGLSYLKYCVHFHALNDSSCASRSRQQNPQCQTHTLCYCSMLGMACLPIGGHAGLERLPAPACSLPAHKSFETCATMASLASAGTHDRGAVRCGHDRLHHSPLPSADRNVVATCQPKELGGPGLGRCSVGPLSECHVLVSAEDHKHVAQCAPCGRLVCKAWPRNGSLRSGGAGQMSHCDEPKGQEVLNNMCDMLEAN